MELKLKHVILTITCLGVLVIVIEQIFQSHSYSSHWNKPKARLTASKTGIELEMVDAFQDKIIQKIKHKYGNDLNKSKRNKGDWVEAEDHDEGSNGIDESNRKEIGQEINVWDRKRWKDWQEKVNGKDKNVMRKKNRSGVRKEKQPHRRNWEKLWSNDDIAHISEEERLRTSPYIFHEEEERKRLSAPVLQETTKYLTYFLPYELKENRKHTFKKCRYNNCVWVNKNEKADMLMIKAATIRDYDEIETYQRPTGQLLLMYTMDPSIRDYKFYRHGVRDQFNATMTYNLDSDVSMIFGRLRKVPPPTDVDFDELYESKSKMSAWFVSHCETPSKREEYVRRMQAMLEVDIVGDCGNITCGDYDKPSKSRSDDSDICMPLLTSTYKFYLAFENAFCIEYVTEKFFKLFAEGVHVIPVVRGGFQYKKYLPSGIFVDADDFQSPEHLSAYLIELGNDKQRYTDMLRRKAQWEQVAPNSRQCSLCEFMHSNPPPKSYPRIQDKFGRNLCWFPKEL